MHGRRQRLILCGLLGLFAGLPAAAPGSAEQIRLKGGAEFKGQVAERTGDSVVVIVPRSDVETIDGEALPPPVTAGTKAPAFSASDLAGATHTVANAEGRVTLIKFWATWCPHCRADIPHLKELFGRYHDKGLDILAVSVDRDLKTLRDFTEREQLPYAVISVLDPNATPEQASLADRYEASGVPSYFLIDGNGMIVQSFSGSVVEGKRDLEGAIKKLLGASAG